MSITPYWSVSPEIVSVWCLGVVALHSIEFQPVRTTETNPSKVAGIRRRVTPELTLMRSWQAHDLGKAVSSITFVINKRRENSIGYLATASADLRALLWTEYGECLGAFGQSREWKIGVPDTYGMRLEGEEESEEEEEEVAIVQQETKPKSEMDHRHQENAKKVMKTSVQNYNDWFAANNRPRKESDTIRAELAEKRSRAKIATPLDGLTPLHLSPHSLLSTRAMVRVPAFKRSTKMKDRYGQEYRQVDEIGCETARGAPSMVPKMPTGNNSRRGTGNRSGSRTAR